MARPSTQSGLRMTSAAITAAACKAAPEEIQGIGDVSYLPEPIPPQALSQEDTPELVGDTEEGELQIGVSAAIRAIPIPLADILVVRMSDGEQKLQRYLQTDDSGNTPIIRLPTPSKQLSEQPEPSGIRPYGVYTVTVSHPDYYTTVVRDVQVFSGQRSLLPVNLIPLSEKATNPSAPDFQVNTDSHPLNESGRTADFESIKKE